MTGPFVPADWEPDPPVVRASHGAPSSDDQPWWRLQPGERAPDGTMKRLSVVHGGTCIDWPAGRHPPGWTHHTRNEVRRLLSRPDEVVPCEKCRPWITVFPRGTYRPPGDSEGPRPQHP